MSPARLAETLKTKIQSLGAADSKKEVEKNAREGKR